MLTGQCVLDKWHRVGGANTQGLEFCLNVWVRNILDTIGQMLVVECNPGYGMPSTLKIVQLGICGNVPCLVCVRRAWAVISHDIVKDDRIFLCSCHV
jgi:hypothetical protein